MDYIDLVYYVEDKMMKENLKGKYVIVRGDRSGVFFGILENKDEQEVGLKEYYI